MASDRLKKLKTWAKSNRLLILTMIGVVLGITLGVVLRMQNLPHRTLEIISLPGNLFLRALYMMVGPLLLSSIINGVTGIESKGLGTTGAIVTVYYLATTVIASSMGLLLGTTVMKIGGNNQENITTSDATKTNEVNMGDVTVDLIKNLVPANIIRAFIQTETTIYKISDTDNSHNDSINNTSTLERATVYSDNVNFIGIIVFSMVFGAAIRNVGEQGEILKKFVDALNHVVMRVILYIMYTSPVGILFLVAGSISMAEKLDQSIVELALLAGVALGGILVHTVLLSGLYAAVLRKNPLKLIVGMKESLMIAWTTMSSYAALPATIRCLEENMKVSKGISRLVLPIGATVNMDAGALHCSLFAAYVANLHNIHLSFGKVVKIILYSSFASIGSAAIPNSFFTAALIALKASDLPTKELALLFATEWFIDRFKTCLNVYGDCVGTCMVNHWKIKNKKESGKGEEMKESEILMVNEQGDDSIPNPGISIM